MRDTRTLLPRTFRPRVFLSVGVFSLVVFSLALLLPAVGAEGEKPSTQTATFAMYCYWTGEATLGRVPGVERSRIGHWAGREIVQVDYDPEATSLEELIRALRRQRSFDALVLPAGSAPPEDPEIISAQGNPHFIEPKHSLRTRHPEFLRLDLTEAQAIALNSWSYFGGSIPDVLTEQQKLAFAAR